MTPALAIIRSKGLPAASSPSAQRRTLSGDARASWTKSGEPPAAACDQTSCAACAAKVGAVLTPRTAETPVTAPRFPVKLIPGLTDTVLPAREEDSELG